MQFEELSLADCAAHIVDNRGKTCPVGDSGRPLIATNCLRDGSLYPTYETTRFVSDDTYKNWFRGHPKPGDLIFVTKGSPGRVCLAPDPVDFCIAQDMVAIRADERKVDPKYLFAVLRSEEAQRRIANMHVGTLIPHFKKGDFDKLFLPFPPLPIQKAIGGLYFDLSVRIDLLQRTNTTLESIAQALFKSWFIDFDPVRAKAEGREPEGMDAATAALFPAEFEESALGLIPKGWKHVPFGTLLETAIGGDWGSELPSAEFSLSAAVIRGTDMPDIRSGSYDRVPRRFVSPKKALNRTLKDGDIVIEVSGGSKTQPTGRSLYVTTTVLEKLNQSVVPTSFCRLFRTRDAETGLLLAQHLDAIYAAGKMWNYQVQSTGLANFQTQHFLGSELVVEPPKEIRLAFYSLVRPLLDKVAGAPIAELSMLRDELLPRLISGKLRLPEAQEKLEEALA